MKSISINKAVMMEEIRTLVREGKTATITVKGHSMSPFIVHLRDRITLGAWRDEDLKPGTVALVRDIYGNYLVHRIIRRQGDKVMLMGDGNIGQKEIATTDNVIAILYSIDRKGKIWKVYPKPCLTWKVYSKVWVALCPLRRYLLAVWRRLR